MAQLFTNNAAGKLAASIDATDTTLVLEAGQGEKFPAITGGDHFVITLSETREGSEVDWEVMRVTSRIGDTLTVERAQEGSIARAWPVLTGAELRLTADSLLNLAPVASLHNFLLIGA